MTCCNPNGKKSQLCEQHLRRRLNYTDSPKRPVIQRIEFGYVTGDEKTVPRPPALLSRDGKPIVMVYCELRMSGAWARSKPPWTTVFCLRDRPDLSGDGVRLVVCEMVKAEIKRLGWGYSRGVKCEP